MKSILFCRVSSKEQEETGYSLPAQEKLLTNYASKNGTQIAKVFAVSESASGKAQRDLFQKMMIYLKKKKIKILICEKADRLTRNFKDAVMIYQWLDEDEQRQVHLVKDSLILHKNSRSQEKLNWDIRIVFAKNYIDNLSEEVKKGQKEKVAQGWLPTKPPPGYKTIGERGHKIHVIDEEVAPLIRKMFELYATGNYSLKKLTKVMLEAGLRSSKGNKVCKSRIHILLQDPFYIGKMHWNGIIYEGKQNPLISKELFEKVQRIMKSKTTPKYTKHFYLFQKLVHCAECKGTITWENQKGLVYGHCNHYRGCTQKTWVKEDQVEEQLLNGFKNLEIKNPRITEWVKKALKESHQDEIVYHQSSVDELNQQYKQVQKRLDRLYDDKLDERITKAFYDRKFQQYTKEKNEVTDAIQKHSKANTEFYNLGISLYELSQKAKDIYLRAKKKGLQEEQRKLIMLVFDNMKLDEGKLSYGYTRAFRILAQAVEATNSSKMQKMGKIKDRIFEPSEKTEISNKKDTLLSQRPIWLPSSLTIPKIFFDKAIISQLKNQLELLAEVLANKPVSPDYALEVINYGPK
ncbi:MAG TPA: recombinase family protein [Candidatus Bathyarchaeia archaeon]|nr:recombinase family protein [Candidatus Bathyarchaeia archaeon]